MAKKIIILSSSPRTISNTKTVVEWFVQGAQQAGAEVEVVDVANLNYKANGCTVCNACQASEKYQCVIADDAQAILDRIPEYDATVLASPIYFAGLNAQMKLILDRIRCLFKINPKTGEFKTCIGHQTMGLIATAGGGMDDSGLPLVDESCRLMAKFAGLKFKSLSVSYTHLRAHET